jgi:hypothetical protein
LATEYLWESIGNTTQAQLVELAGYLRRDAEDARQPRIDRAIPVARRQHCGESSSTDVAASGNRNHGHLPRGWWIRSLITRFDFGDDLDTFVQCLIAIFPFCPNLKSFSHIHDHNGPLPSSVINALANYCGRTLIRFQLDWGGVHIDDLIHLLDHSGSLQHIALGCTYNPPASDLLPAEERELLKREFKFDQLQTLQFGNSEDGMIYKFNSHLLEAATWNVPSLSTVAIDLDARTSIDEVLGFLQAQGGKLKSLSLTDSGRLDGIPITWNDIFALCPRITELRTTYNPFVHFNIAAFAAELSEEDAENGEGDPDVDVDADLDIAVHTETAATSALPQFVIESVATRLERLCFDQWEFFPGIDCVMGHGAHGDGAYLDSPTDPEQFLASILADSQDQDQDNPTEQLPADVEVEVDKTTQERSERLLKAYCRVLDNVFKDIGGKMTPSLRVIQFDFPCGRLDLPKSCLDWWNNWVQRWQSKGLQVEGPGRIPL